eukprot:TRINITY_DN1485_c0_g1_i6.p1 TRINITY_DN1485_c0_g1~~TRINITY_DN1485_c0_g1_i6.p1  ORF type:complete len:135 (+),score=2.55 TRINITY_DN1485_c0_g1_i6:571-975(+)
MLFWRPEPMQDRRDAKSLSTDDTPEGDHPPSPSDRPHSLVDDHSSRTQTSTCTLPAAPGHTPSRVSLKHLFRHCPSRHPLTATNELLLHRDKEAAHYLAAAGELGTARYFSHSASCDFGKGWPHPKWLKILSGR